MSDLRHSESAFETVIEQHLLANGYVSVPREGFDRERAIFPEEVLGFIRATQPAEWARLEALRGAGTGEQVLADLCKWMDMNGSLATLRHGFKCYAARCAWRSSRRRTNSTRNSKRAMPPTGWASRASFATRLAQSSRST